MWRISIIPPSKRAWLGPIPADYPPCPSGCTLSINFESNARLPADNFDDGVRFFSRLNRYCSSCDTDSVDVMVNLDSHYDRSQPLYIYAWFDWNSDGDWDDVDTCLDGQVVFEAIHWIGAERICPNYGYGYITPDRRGVKIRPNEWEGCSAIYRLYFRKWPSRGLPCGRDIWTRFRLTPEIPENSPIGVSNAGSYTGEVISGEVEDYRIPCECIPNHYKTWRVRGTLRRPHTVFVRDQFMRDRLRLVRIDYLSNPVKKVVGNRVFDIVRPEYHLTWYRAMGRPISRRVGYVNQFESTAVHIDSVKYLLVPTRKLPHRRPRNLDHYKAYRIANPRSLHISSLSLKDQFDARMRIYEHIDSLVPRYFLTPARKNNEPMYDSVTHYVAYEIFPKRIYQGLVRTIDQFGRHYMEIDTSKFLLVPSKKFFPTPPETIPNHYKTWRVRDTLWQHRWVHVRDQFMRDTLRLVRIDYLSNPVKKVVGNRVFDIVRPEYHLTWYRAMGRPISRRVGYVNQFESTAVHIDSVKYLLVPTRKLPHRRPRNLDHYKAYRIANPRSLHISSLSLKDQFDARMRIYEHIDSLVPRYFLTPARKNNEPMYDSVTHYVAYEIFPKRIYQGLVRTIDQFGRHYMEIDTSKFLLVPSKKFLPTPTTCRCEISKFYVGRTTVDPGDLINLEAGIPRTIRVAAYCGSGCSITSYNWVVHQPGGGTSTFSGSSFSYTFTCPGATCYYTITLTITCSDGSTCTSSFSVHAGYY